MRNATQNANNGENKMLTLNEMCEMTTQELDAAFASYGRKIELLRKSAEERKAMSETMRNEYLVFMTELKCCLTHLDPKNRQRIEARRVNKSADDAETIILDGITVGKPW